MRLRLVDLVVLPAKALRVTVSMYASAHRTTLQATHLCDAHGSPFVLPEKLQGSFRRVVVLFGDRLEHRLWKLDVSILILVVRVSASLSARSLYEVALEHTHLAEKRLPSMYTTSRARTLSVRGRGLELRRVLSM